MSPVQTGERTWIDEAADRFECDWKRGGDRPRIEDFLARRPGRAAPCCSRSCCASSASSARLPAKRPHSTEYRQRFPDDRAAVDAAFGIAMRMSIRRPRPSAGHAAQSLLFGLLALQNNFIDRETLLAAFNAWVADKSRSLGQILLDRGALSPARHAVLQSLVQEHLQQHGFDPERSLAVAHRRPRGPRRPRGAPRPRPPGQPPLSPPRRRRR